MVNERFTLPLLGERRRKPWVFDIVNRTRETKH